MGNFPAQRQHPVEAYASAASVRQGDSIGFHVAVAAPTEEDVQLEVFHYAQLQFDAKRLQEKLSAIGVFDEDYREAIAVAPEEEPLYRAEFPGPVLPPPAYPTPGPGEKPDASRGCGWPEAHRLTVPADWKSGPYLARFGAAEAVTWVLFVVRPAAGQRSARILCALATNTYQAYNPWNDNSFYADLPQGTAQAAKLSFDRPNHLFGFLLFDQSFLAWLDQSYEVDFGANHDLHAEADPLAGYSLFLSLGHDEYWSAEMRDRVESFVEAGGNAAFFSGNTCYWQVRFEDGDRTLVCYKDAALDRQANPGIPAERATAVWYDPPISRPTNDLTGLSYRSAAAITDRPRAAIGFTVADRRSWVFAGTGLADGAVFGQKDAIVGYECDARDFDTPRGFHTLAAGAADAARSAGGADHAKRPRPPADPDRPRPLRRDAGRRSPALRGLAPGRHRRPRRAADDRPRRLAVPAPGLLRPRRRGLRRGAERRSPLVRRPERRRHRRPRRPQGDRPGMERLLPGDRRERRRALRRGRQRQPPLVPGRKPRRHGQGAGTQDSRPRRLEQVEAGHRRRRRFPLRRRRQRPAPLVPGRQAGRHGQAQGSQGHRPRRLGRARPGLRRRPRRDLRRDRRRQSPPLRRRQPGRQPSDRRAVHRRLEPLHTADVGGRVRPGEVAKASRQWKRRRPGERPPQVGALRPRRKAC